MRNENFEKMIAPGYYRAIINQIQFFILNLNDYLIINTIFIN